MSKNPAVCQFEACRAIGRPRHLPHPPLGSGPRPPQASIEICGAHWPDVRAKTAAQAHWRAALRDGSLSFDALGARS